jgi:2-polyprenyl-3-methyl-5-hydroxy-6-metoxy-1,4-benzoquinol methylase
LSSEVSADRFRITDADYGITADLYQCEDCQFRFCPTVRNVTAFYEAMEDAAYEATRKERALQTRDILALARKYKNGGKLLDVGAGSGILVEQAKNFSFDPVGIEPSKSLSGIAQTLKLPVITGVLPQVSFANAFDVVMLIDVIEHVEYPGALLREAGNCMAKDAICIIVTPDVGSLAARLMGYRWWHYRLAHIGYFNQHSLAWLAHASGMKITGTCRPGWHFPASYLIRRVMRYFPEFARFEPPAWTDRVTIPLNLLDSLLVVCKKETD